MLKKNFKNVKSKILDERLLWKMMDQDVIIARSVLADALLNRSLISQILGHSVQ